MLAEIDMLKNQHNTMDTQLGDLETSMGLISSDSMTGDYFYMNDREIQVPQAGEHLIREFSVPAGEMLDLTVNITSAENGKNNALWLRLYQDDVLVATSIDDGDGKDDNASVAMLFKRTMTQNSTFKIKVAGGSGVRKIPRTQLQIGYKTYGAGHDLTVLN